MVGTLRFAHPTIPFAALAFLFSGVHARCDIARCATHFIVARNAALTMRVAVATERFKHGDFVL
jgi:hypothetical protein